MSLPFHPVMSPAPFPDRCHRIRLGGGREVHRREHGLIFHSQQGEVYAKVINDVCEHSRQDFEEGGVELATLDLLRAVGACHLFFASSIPIIS